MSERPEIKRLRDQTALSLVLEELLLVWLAESAARLREEGRHEDADAALRVVRTSRISLVKARARMGAAGLEL